MRFIFQNFTFMKKITFPILLIMTTFSVFGQNSDNDKFEKLWKELNNLIEKDQPQSALSKIDKIYSLAQSKKNDYELIKSVTLKSVLLSESSKDGIIKAIEFAEEQTQKLSGTNKYLSHFVLGALYQNYYSRNRYSIDIRSAISDLSDETASRLEFYDKTEFQKIIIGQYKLALNSELKNVKSDAYKDFFENDKSAETFFTTIYDKLGYAIIKQLENLESYQKVNLDEKFICNSDDFQKITIENSDQEPTMAILYFMQQLLSANSADINTFSLIDLKRIMYLKKHQSGKDEEIMKLLNEASEKYSDKETSIFINAEIAEYNTLADILDFSLLVDKADAVKLLEKTIAKFPQSKFIETCKNIYTKYTFPSVEFRTSEIVYPAENIPIYITYENAEKTNLKIVKVSNKASEMRNFDANKNEIKKLYQQSPVFETEINLPKTSDYESHQTCYVSKGLENGFYLIFNDIQNEDEKGINYCKLAVSKLALLQIDGTKYIVIDRNSGKPIKGANVKVIATANGKTQTLFQGETDNDGIFSYEIPENKYYYRVGATVSYGKDEMQFSVNIYDDETNTQEEIERRTNIFTDRAIYRPGQTVYFKAIIYEGENNNFNVVPNEEVSVGIYDTNGRRIAKQTLTTNNFGSVNGNFQLPTSTLNGYFYLKAYASRTNAEKYFRVEEYKRPTFEITMENFENEVAFGDSVTIKGNAKSFSGVAISDAEVKFNVVCSSYSPIWWRRTDISDEQYLTDGVVKTDENGDFAISFVAKECFADINKFDIEIVVSDINGESQTANKSLNVSKQSLWLSSEIDEIEEISTFNKFEINTLNISGNHIDAVVNIEIEKLEEPAKATISAISSTDQKIYTREEWEKLCPNIEYDNENNLENRKAVSVIYKGSINTANSNIVSFDENTKFTTGSYRITLKTNDKDGKEISEVMNFRIFDNNSNSMPYVATDIFKVSQTTAKVGDTVELKIGTSFSDAIVYYAIQTDNKPLYINTLQLNNEAKTIKIPVTEECYGNFGITAIFVKFGSRYVYNQTINVERENKELDVKFITFRDKTLPGAEETWQLKISDKFGNPANAEFMTTVYDASLDVYEKYSMNLSPYSQFRLKNNFSANGFNSNSSYYFIGIYPPFAKECNPYPTATFYNLFDSYYSAYWRHIGFDTNEVCYSIAPQSANEEAAFGMYEMADAIATKESYADAEFEENDAETTSDEKIFENVNARTNFNETAIFAPSLTTDKDGNVFVKFTIPESLTRWNMFGLAHTADMKIGEISNNLITQKKVSITPNLPRFFREGDEMFISAKIANLSEKTINGKARIEFTNAETSENITDKFLKNNTLDFIVDSNKNIAVEWKISVPKSIGAVSVRIVAVGDEHSDGEEKILPILTNRMMVTETMPLPVRRAGTTKFSFDAMKNNQSKTLENYSYTLEFTSNPAWYAVLALPYMMEYPYECAEQTFSRLYSNLIASHVANSDPKIYEMFEKWKSSNAETMKSNLQRNEELKSVVLENSPWLLEAENEAESKQNIGMLFDINRLQSEVAKSIAKLQKMQKANGGFPWFDGMSDNLYVTQHIVGEYGHLRKLGVAFPDKSIEGIIKKAVKYIDNEIKDVYNKQKETGKISLGNTQIHYLYVRSFFLNDISMDKSTKNVFDEYMKIAENEWKNAGFYMRGMLALAMNRSERTETAKTILESLKQYAQHSEELGMYWDFEQGWYWYNNGIETQSLLIELFSEMGETEDANEMKVWLLKQKQTQNWETTKATAEAVYALLLNGTSILTETDYPTITFGNKKIDLSAEKTEDGTGYFKKTWKEEDISAKWSEISVEKSDSSVAWGGVYWQYFEDLDKIKTFENTPLKIRKSLFVNKVENEKEVLVAVNKKNALKIGDKVTVRIEIEVDRNMEYIHLKDMRASAFEPVEKLSGYKFKNALGYYQSIKDASMNFFIDYLPKGTYVFEYEVIATQKGKFSNGITTIQSMYAPEYSSHSKGDVIKVE